ncbi:protein MpNPF11 [Marchantia polymorpha subsp. ruderalis]
MAGDRKMNGHRNEQPRHVIIRMASNTITKDENVLGDGSMDYCGQVARRNTTGGWKTGPFILGPETCEKLAVGGIVINLVPFLTGQLHLSSSYSANLVTTYQGTSYIFTLLGGFVADAMLGRFLVTTGASVIQFLGLLMLTLSATFPFLKPKECAGDNCQPQTGTPLIVTYISLYLIALGTGGIKACASPFGADQFDPHHEQEKKSLNGFFSWYFFTITCGAFFAVTVLVYIQDHVGREWGYLIPTVCMLLVIVAFIMARRLYRYKAPKGSPLTLIAQVFVSAYKKRKLPLPADADSLYELSSKDRPQDYVPVQHSNQFKFLDKAAIIEDLNDPETRSPWRLGTVTSVEETKMVLRLLPILLTTSLFYTVYAQMTTFSVAQGRSMERKMGGHFEFPAPSMGAFLQGGILLSLFLWEKAFIPIARRFTGNKKGVSSLHRISYGLLLSIVTMVIAGFVEKKRMQHVHEQHLGLDPAEEKVVRMSIFWLLPQYMLVGAGEGLTYAGQLDFFYNESPKAMRSMGAALCVCTLSIGYYTSSLLVSLVNSVTGHSNADGSISGAWLPDDIDTGKLYNFYWMLAIVSSVNFVLFVACAHWYKYKAEAALDSDEELEIHLSDDDDSDARSQSTVASFSKLPPSPPSPPCLNASRYSDIKRMLSLTAMSFENSGRISGEHEDSHQFRGASPISRDESVAIEHSQPRHKRTRTRTQSPYQSPEYEIPFAISGSPII